VSEKVDWQTTHTAERGLRRGGPPKPGHFLPSLARRLTRLKHLSPQVILGFLVPTG
jgi:hypothetical protein